MTDRIQYMTVVLNLDVVDEYAEEIQRAIAMIKGVHHVELGKPVEIRDFLARQRVYSDVRKEIFDVFARGRYD